MTAPTQRPASCSDARKRLAERNPAPTTDLCATAEQVASRCIELHKRGNPDPNGSTSTYRQAAEVIGGLVDALASRTPDAHLAAAKAEGWDEGFTRGFYDALAGGDRDASESAAENPYARAARLREQGGE